MFKPAFGLAAILLLTACQTTGQPPVVPPGTTVYGSSEIGRAIRTTDDCRIEAVRQVAIRGDSRDDHRRAQRRDAAGTLTGAVIGAAIGNEIGNGDGRRVATVLGAIGGAAVGRAAAEEADNRARIGAGLEYTVRVGRDRRVIVQPYDGVAIPSGGACRLVGNSAGIRVLPR